MSEILTVTKNEPVPTYRFVARCSTCDWTDSWPLQGMSAACGRLHIRETGHPSVLIEDHERETT